LVILIVLGLILPQFRHWAGSQNETLNIAIFAGLAAFSVVLVPSASRRYVSELFQIQSIRSRFTPLVLFGGAALGLVGVYLAQSSAGYSGAGYPLLRRFSTPTVEAKYCAVILVGAVFEEVILRGFLYRAFRDRYAVVVSVSIVVLFAMLGHTMTLAVSYTVFVVGIVFQITLCLILEKTNNLWNCIAFHFIYNAVVVGTLLMRTAAR
jgi:membrane protease YdiL (CAAX protease family)